jgi:ABC-type proline/glycine betaine transport system substrate-binding protein
MLTHRHALALAGVLAATVLTGGAAILGIAHTPSRTGAAAAPIVQTVQPAQQNWEEGD